MCTAMCKNEAKIGEQPNNVSEGMRVRVRMRLEMEMETGDRTATHLAKVVAVPLIKRSSRVIKQERSQNFNRDRSVTNISLRRIVITGINS